MLDRLGQAKKHNAELLVFKKPATVIVQKIRKLGQRQKWPQVNFTFGGQQKWRQQALTLHL